MRGRTVAVVLVLALLAGGVGGWLVRGGDDDAADSGEVAVTLTDVDRLPDAQYRFSAWWSDGQTALRASPEGDGVLLQDALADRRTGNDPRVAAGLPAPVPVSPTAVAALPGEGGAPWIVVGLPYDNSTEGEDRIARPLAWSGVGQTDRFDRTPTAAAAATVPVNTTRERADLATPSIDVALSRVGGRAVGLATVYQSRSTYGSSDPPEEIASGTVRCDDLRRCRWRSAEATYGRLDALASTGSGFVAVTGGEDAKVLYADDAALTWRKIGAAPRSASLALAQDGDGSALLVWRRRGDDGSDKPATLAVQAVRNGKLSDAVAAGPVPDDTGLVNAVLRVKGTWLIGTDRPVDRDAVDLRYRASQAVLLRRAGKRWVAIVAPVLAAQPDQRVQALAAAADGAVDAGDGEPDIEMATTSPVLRIDETWTVDVDGDDD